MGRFMLKSVTEIKCFLAAIPAKLAWYFDQYTKFPSL
jgi:hypothetical protein